MVLVGGADTHVRSFGEESRQEGRPRPRSSVDWTDWTCVVPAAAWAGCSHCPEPSARSWVLCPRLAFCHLLICLLPFWVWGIEPSCPALPCPSGSPCWSLSWGTCFQKPCPASPRRGTQRARGSLCECFGVGFYQTARDVLSRFLVAAVCASHMACLPYQSLAVPPPPWFPWQSQVAHGTEGPRDALRSEGQEAIWAVGDPSDHHPRTLSWNGNSPGLHSWGGFLSLWGPLERGIVLIYKYI